MQKTKLRESKSQVTTHRKLLKVKSEGNEKESKLGLLAKSLVFFKFKE